VGKWETRFWVFHFPTGLLSFFFCFFFSFFSIHSFFPHRLTRYGGLQTTIVVADRSQAAPTLRRRAELPEKISPWLV